jgi:hypothetical protein
LALRNPPFRTIDFGQQTTAVILRSPVYALA